MRMHVDSVDVLLVAKLPGEDNLLLASDILDLEGTILDKVLDASGQGLVLFDVVLVLNFAGELGGKLLIGLTGR
jgi:hypothetical protein